MVCDSRVLGLFAEGHFAEGCFAVGHFTVRTLRLKDISPWDISPYFSPCRHFVVNISLEFFEVSTTFDSQSNLVADCRHQLVVMILTYIFYTKTVLAK